MENVNGNSLAKLIVFEGIDGCGKSTQAELLTKFIIRKGYKCELVCEKWGNKFIESQANLLNEDLSPITKALLFNAIRIEHTKNVLLPAMMNNDFVIMDRRELSTFVYQGVIDRIEISKLFSLHNLNPIGIVADYIFLINVSHIVANERLKVRDNEVVDKWTLSTSTCYDVFSPYINTINIDGEKSKHIVHKKIVNLFYDLFGDKLNESF